MHTGLRHALIAVLLFSILALPASAYGPEDREGLNIDSLNCKIDGKEIDPAADKALFEELELLWNPSNEAQEFPSRGPRIIGQWESQGESSVLSCEFTFAGVQPWRAAAIESKRDINSVTLIVEDGNYAHTFYVPEILKLRNRRITAPDYIPARKITFEIEVPCSSSGSSDSACRLDLEEITLFAKVPEITYGAADAAMPFSILPSFLPGDALILRGGVDQRAFVCTDSMRNYCSWSQAAVCETHGFLGSDKDCEYDVCPSSGEYYGGKRFLDVQHFDSGRCSSWIETYFPQVIAIGIMVWAAILTGGTAAAWIPNMLWAIGGAFSAYDPRLSFSDQWFNVVMGAVQGYYMGGLGGSPFGLPPAQAAMAVGKNIAASYARSWIIDELDIEFSGIIGTITRNAINGGISMAIRTAATAGMAEGFDPDAGPLSVLGALSPEDFITQSHEEIRYMWRDIVRRAMLEAADEIMAEACDSDDAACRIAASAAGDFLSDWAEPHIMSGEENEMQAEISTVGQFSTVTREVIKGTAEIYSMALNGESLAGIFPPDAASELAASAAAGASFSDFLADERVTSAVISSDSVQNLMGTLEQDFVMPTPDQRSVLDSIVSTDPDSGVPRIEALNLAGEFLYLDQSTTGIVYAIQNTVSIIQQRERTAEQLGRQLERSLGLNRCSCYGQISLLTHPQYLLNPVECESFSYKGRTIQVEVPRIGPSGVPDVGNGWCRQPLEIYSWRQKGGLVEADLMKGSSVITSAEGVVEQGGQFFVSGIRMPAEHGKYFVNLTSTTGATSALYEAMDGTIRTVESLPATPYLLPFALNLVRTTHQRLSDAGLSGHASLVEGMKQITEEIASYSMPLEGHSGEFARGADALNNLLSGVQNLEARADNSNYETSFDVLAADITGIREALQAALGSGSVATLAGIETAQKLGSLRTKMNSVDSAFYTPRARGAEQKARNIDLYLTAGNPSGTFPYVWYETSRRNCGRGECLGYTGYKMLYDVISVHEEDPGVHITELDEIPIAYSGARWTGDVTRDDDGVYMAGIKILDAIQEFEILSSGILEYLRDGSALELQWNSQLPASFVEDMEELKEFSQELSQRSSALLRNLYELHGKCIRTDLYTGYCSMFGVSSLTPAWRVAKPGSRKSLGRAIQGAHVLANVSALVEQFYNVSGDAAWHARLNSYPQRDDFNEKLEELESSISDMLAAAVGRRAGDIETAAAGAMQNLDALKEITADELKHSVRKRVDVMETGFSAQAAPGQMCGTGKPFAVNTTVHPTAYWPVMDVEADTWTPFSVPYVPKQALRLRDIVSGCDVKQIAWWNNEIGRDERRMVNAGNTEIVPGRGYYILTGNRCRISFDLSLFETDAEIGLSPGERAISSRISFFGSSSGKLILSRDSLSTENEIDYAGLLLGKVYATKGCAPARHEVYEGFYRERPAAEEWTEFRKALPSDSYPFSPDPDIIRQRSEPANVMEPGSAYFAWASSGECEMDKLPASLPTSLLGIGTKGIVINASYSLPEGWNVEDDQLAGFGGFSFSSMAFCNGTFAQYCAGIGDSATFHRIIRPKLGNPGERELIFGFLDEITGNSAQALLSYNLVSPKPEIRATKTLQGFSAAFTADITSDIPQMCGEHEFAIRTEIPPGWNVDAGSSVLLESGRHAAEKVIISPVPGKAQSGYASIIVFSDTPEYERFIEGKISASDISCSPSFAAESVRDIDANGTHVFYSTGYSIDAIDKKTCATERLVAAPGIKGLEENSGKIFWLQGTEAKMLDMESGAVRTIAQAAEGSFFISADSSSAYWIEGSDVIKASISSGEKTIIAENADRPLGIDAENNYVYWTEPRAVRKVHSGASCYSNDCPVESLVEEALVTESGRLASIDVSNGIFVSVINPDAPAPDFLSAPPRDVGKIIRIGDFAEVIAKPQRLLGMETGVSSVAVDDEYAYFVHSAGVEQGGYADRISRFAHSAVYSELIEVPGRVSPLVFIEDSEKNASAGTVVVFEINVTNRNTEDSLEPEQAFRIVGFEAEEGLSLCAPDVLGVSFFECEDSGYEREFILDYAYSEGFAAIVLGPGESGSLHLAVKLDDGIEEIGKRFELTAYVAGVDAARPVAANAYVISDAPGPPEIEIKPLASCYSLEPGFISHGCTAMYMIQVENPEQVAVQYDLSVIEPEPEANWEVRMDRTRMTVQGIYGANTDFASMEITPRALTPYGAYVFVVRAENRLFPEKFTEKPLVMMLTPDNGNGICEPARGETPENTRDCRSDFFTCAFDGSCSSTTPGGVLFSAMTAEYVGRFAVCRTGSVGSSGFAGCRYDAERGGERIICTSEEQTTVPYCSYQCADEERSYMLIAKPSGSEDWKRSPAFEYSCPLCTGKVKSRLVETDALFTALLNPENEEYRQGIVPFDVWADYIAEEHMRADLTNLEACNAILSDTYTKARNIINERISAGSSIFPVNQGICAELRQRAQFLVNQTDELIWEICRNGLSARLVADELSVSDVSSGGTKAHLNVTNAGLEDASAQIACSYEAPGERHESLSSCETLEPRQKKEFEAELRNATQGFWTVSCTLGWSPYSDCSVVVPVLRRYTAFDITLSTPIVEIIYALVPEFAYAGQEASIEVVSQNTGGAANIRAECTGRLEGEEVVFESSVLPVGTASVRNLMASYVPQSQGTIEMEQCSVFIVAGSGEEILADFIRISDSIPVWSACTLGCQRNGFSFGTETGGSCTCGRLRFSGAQCSRKEFSGKNGVYNASFWVEWQLGDELRIEGEPYSNSGFQYSRLYTGTGVYNISSLVISSGKAVYGQETAVACFAPPAIEIISPENGADVSSDADAVLRIADAGSVSLYLNGNFFGEYETPDNGILPVSMPLAQLYPGVNEIFAEACNAEQPSLCSFASRAFEVSYAAFSGFILDPATAVYNAVPGNDFDIPLKITNGAGEARITANASSGRNWSMQVMLKDGTFAALKPDEESNATLRISVPESAVIGDTAEIFLALRSASVSRTFGPYRIVVSSENAAPPFVLSLRHMPETGIAGEPLSFYADIISASPLSQLSVCRSQDCRETWCSMNAAGETGLANFSCSAMPEKGAYSYALRARSINGLESTTSERDFAVAEKSSACEELRGKVTAESMPEASAENAFDDNINTYWTSRRGLPRYVTLEMEEADGVGGIELFSLSPSRPRALQIEVSEDCFTYKTAYQAETDRGASRFGTDGSYSARFGARSARCIRLVAAESQGSADYVSLAEIKFCRGSVEEQPEQANDTTPGAGGLPEEGSNLPIIILAVAIIIVLAVFRHKIQRWVTYMQG